MWGSLSWSGRGSLPGTEEQRRRRRRARIGVITVVATAVTVGMLPSAYAMPLPGSRSGVELVDLPKPKLAGGRDGGDLAEMTTGDALPGEDYEPKKMASPAGTGITTPATGTVDGLTPGETQQISSLPIEIGAPATADAAEAAALEGDWQVALADRAEVDAADIQGLVFTVKPPATATGDATVALDYTEFAELYGANWADRLQLVKLPECFLTTPEAESCSEPVEVDTTNVVVPKDSDVGGDGILDGERRVEAILDVAEFSDPAAPATGASAVGAGTITDALYRAPLTHSAPLAPARARTAASGSGSSVFMATSGGSGAKGDFSATPLASAGSWAAGSSSGAFTYTYELQPPSVPGGPAPSLGFGYNSQGVDGRTSSTNNQASWIGDGWEYNPGSITRTYRTCRDDTENGNNTKRKTSDMCWGSDNATLTLGGTTTELVKDDNEKGDAWVTANGDGSRVRLKRDTSLDNGDDLGEYWEVTTRDGTVYSFGRHKLPGWSGNGDAADDPVTDSVLTVPVSGNQPGEDCYDADFSKSFCTRGWRWNLDYVVDTSGSAMSLWWDKEENLYAQNMKFKKPVSYDRGGYLKRIEYGQRTNTLFSAAPLARVDFTVDERCFMEDSIACSEANFTSGDFAKNRIWYDTPADLLCRSGKDCYVPVPTFWSRVRLAQVTTYTQRTQGSTALSKVDSWTLGQSLPAERTDEGTALWLDSITRSGYDTDGESIALRPVTFVPNTQPMPNRVRRGPKDPNPIFDRLRIERIVSEYGGETLVDYRAPTGPCRTGTGFPAPESNTELCFPAYWHPDPDKVDESIEWFNKYVVDTVQELPAVKGVAHVNTSYVYGDNADTKGAWALNQAEFSKKKTRTYDQWRGFSRVRTVSGADSADPFQGSARSMSEVRFFRGMNGDPLPENKKRQVTVLDSDGAKIAEDDPAFQGRVAEELSYTGYNGTLISRSVDYPVAVELASRTRTGGIPALKAYRVLDDHTLTKTRSSGTFDKDETRQWRSLRTNTTYDDTYGLPVTVESLGDTGKTGDESCSVLSYVHNTTAHLIGLEKETLTTAGTCAQAASAKPAARMSGSRIAYDSTAFGAAPSSGLATTTWSLTGDGAGWQQTAKIGYDSYGRAESTTNAKNETEHTTYVPTTGQVYSVVQENAKKHITTTYVEPGRGTTLKEVDPNGRSTLYAYDALGRTTDGWGTSQGADEPASVKFTYNTAPGEPVSVVSSTLKDDGTGYDESMVFYDGLGRERQRQEPAVGDGRLITDTIYSANGTIERTNNGYYAEGGPQSVMFEVDSDFKIPNATLYKYDGQGRILAETPYEAGTTNPAKATRYDYGYDWSTVIPPTGGAAQRSWSDALGRTVRVDSFTDAARTSFRSTSYSFDARGDRIKAEDSSKNVWSWTYDALGRQVTATDPDTGTTRTEYDVLGRPELTTDSRDVKVWTGYDALGRPVAQRRDSSEGELLSEADYDKVIGGIGLPSSSTRYTDQKPYISTVTGYTADYQPTGSKLTLPATVAAAYGLQETYSYAYEYGKSGQLKSASLPAAGGLGPEKIVTRYNDDGLPISTSGLDWYTAETSYSVYGEVLRAVTGENPNRVWTTNLYDESTGELTSSITDRESKSDTSAVLGNRVNARSYAYDPAGNVTKIEDTVDAYTDRQCFSYDPLGQLTQAWTTHDSACGVKTDGTPSTVTIGKSADGYRKTYTYDAMGNRKTEVDHYLGLVNGSTAVDPAKDATTTYSYGKADGSQPHTLTGMSSTYVTDAGAKVTEASTRTYDKAGNTETRIDGGDEQGLKWTWDGKLEKVTGFGETGAGAWTGLSGKCLDLSSSSTVAGTALQLFSCNGTRAQQLRIDGSTPTDSSKGALKVLDRCAVPKGGAGADGTPVVIADCTGAAAQEWTAVATGHKLKHVASGKCLVVPGANPAVGTDLQLGACDTNGASQSWAPADETTYVYGPSGERLMALTANTRTLFLGDTTVSVNSDGTPAYTERYYQQPGAPVVMRFKQGGGAEQVSMQVTDQNGTAYINVQLAAGNAVKFDKTDPFGAKRNESANWSSHKGYIGGNDDKASGLIHLGAREYEPETGRFLSADPVLDLADPVQMNGYVYCENNPVTFADPSGLASDGGGVSGYGGGGGVDSAEEAWAKKQLNTSLSDIILNIGWAVFKEFVGWNDVVSCFSRGDMWACGSLIIDAIPWTAVFSKGKKIWRAVEMTFNAISAWRKAQEKARKIIAMAKAAREAAKKAAAAVKAAAKKAAQAKKRAQEAATRQVKKAAEKTGNAVQKTKRAAAKSNEKPKSAAARSSGKEGGGKKSGGSCAVGNSFVPGTQVVMADGSTKPIEKVKNGDEVLATNPETGETSAETVTAEIEGKGVKHLVGVTIDTDGDKGDDTASVTATDGHPFWVQELGEWVDAADLKSGEWLRTSAGTYVQITEVERWTAPDETVHNLTVRDAHTYYVVAEATPVLVHNCGKKLTDVALGTSDNKLEEWAIEKGYTHFMRETRDGSISSAADAMNYHPEATIHVRLDGFTLENKRSGNPAEVFDYAVQQGHGDNWFTTQREMAFLERAFRVGNLDSSRLRFYLGGSNITSEVLKGSKYLGGS
ncbi:polymorphic toxin-type HINT domain-containing protein [Streptomyces sp. NBC_01433]|uniref:polymorphic toxin-type HINT domain-containing protein n=1 Tax=Streptomyces sp. NBC_01433 TaxID=2903864 RepID=UPI00224E58A1|nr:polymorphic toxin-type HINT domain-containing protein [Streptomyces sp. NBC_01433]MCX4674867.1 polymorphic toxin-type HINT domain-containing protein [Streptomyces sp. NBC_01433]